MIRTCLFWLSIRFQTWTLSIRLSMSIAVTYTCLQVWPHIMYPWCLSKCKMLIFFSFQSFTLQWGHNVTWVSCENQLQPVDSYLETIYILFNINHTAVFGLVNSTNGKYIVVYKFTESWTWASFIKLESTNIVCSVLYAHSKVPRWRWGYRTNFLMILLS